MNIPSKYTLILFVSMCERLECNPLDLGGVFMSESGWSAAAHNPNGDASGLCQMMPSTLRLLKYPGDPGDFRALSERDQLPWVEKYYAPARGRLTNRTACYLWTFLPAYIAHAADNDFVLAAKADARTGFIYAANAAFDANKDLSIRVGELAAAIDRACRSDRWSKIRAEIEVAACQAPTPADTIPSGAVDLTTVRGIQKALVTLGYVEDVDVDGVLGPKTRAALVEYQSRAGLIPDGIPGPLTRASLQFATGLLRVRASLASR